LPSAGATVARKPGAAFSPASRNTRSFYLALQSEGYFLGLVRPSSFRQQSAAFQMRLGRGASDGKTGGQRTGKFSHLGPERGKERKILSFQPSFGVNGTIALQFSPVPTTGEGSGETGKMGSFDDAQVIHRQAFPVEQKTVNLQALQSQIARTPGRPPPNLPGCGERRWDRSPAGKYRRALQPGTSIQGRSTEAFRLWTSTARSVSPPIATFPEP